MKKLLFILFLIVGVYSAQAQIQHTVDGKEYDLTEEISGKLSLYYAVIDNEYRYFIKKDNEITELVNTRGEDGKFQEEYKEVLSIVSADAGLDISKVNLTIPSLKEFADEYNKAKDINYKMQSERPKPKARFGGFAGVSNNPFVTNPENKMVPIIGLDFEVYDVKRTRSSLFFGFKQSFTQKTDIEKLEELEPIEYSSSQLSLGYRFRIINKEKFALYPQVTLVTYTFANSKSYVVDGATTTISNESTSSFDAPIIIGIGADIKLGNGFITLSANELFGVVNIENQGNFPVDLRLGYKFNL